MAVDPYEGMNETQIVLHKVSCELLLLTCPIRTPESSSGRYQAGQLCLRVTETICEGIHSVAGWAWMRIDSCHCLIVLPVGNNNSFGHRG